MRTLLRLLLLPMLLAAAALAMPVKASAETGVCIERPSMVDTLIDNYGEQLSEVHEVKGRGLLEFHVSPTDGTWTALLTNTDGMSCVLATGEGLDPAKSLYIESGYKI